MTKKELDDIVQRLFAHPSESYALFQGASQFPEIAGRADFYPLWGGTIVSVNVSGLPFIQETCAQNIYGFHIHEGNSCQTSKDSDAAFSLTGNHYNPQDCLHPEHAGDLPPLFGNEGFAFQLFYTNRFVPEEIVGKTIVIHSAPDDFASQPSGNSGIKIACGEIKSTLEIYD